MLLSATKFLVYFIIFLLRLAGSWYVCFLYGRLLEVEEIMDEKGEKINILLAPLEDAKYWTT